MRSFAHILSLLSLMVAIAAFGERRGMILSKKPAAADSGASSAHVLVDFETGANGDAWVTNNATGSALLTNAASIGTSLGLWRINSNNAYFNSNTLLRVSTTQARRGTRSFRVHCTQDWSYAEFGLKNDFPKVSWSIWFRIDDKWDGNDFGSHDMQDFRADSGDFAINNVDSQPGTIVYGAHTGTGVGATQGPFTSNYWYNVQGLYDVATKGFLLRYYSNGVSMGQSSNNITVGTPGDLRVFRIGHCDNHGKFVAGFAYMDDLEIWTNGTFPNTPVGGALP